ncbi:MAG: Hsp33 family molecular chaperone HslO [Pseudanabaenaceae cyanobacterium bins.39]|nr:Hsp33 family molecular chaperone HslO [Pseudanabaenaceae cyanobacterium bins.39]
MQDRLIRSIAADARVRIVGVSLTEALNEAYRRHRLSAVAMAALGRTMGASLLLASNMKQAQARVNVRVAGDGELGLVYADAGFDGTVRGFVSNPHLDLPANANGTQNVEQAVGASGLLKVLRDVGYGEPYSSVVELTAGNVSDDVAWFLASSEQTYSQMILVEDIDLELVSRDRDYQTAPVNFAAGVLLQVMPKAAMRAARTANLSQEVLISQLETKGDMVLFKELLRQGKNIEQVMLEMFADINIEILPMSKDVHFHCPCSLDRMLGAIKILGESELRSMIEEDQGAEATCHFCGEVYQATTEQLHGLLAELQIEAAV